MRILTRRIYRAFPELDRYDDERCERFIRAAKRGWWRQALRLVVIYLAFMATGFVTGIPIAFMSEYFDHHASAHGWILVLVSIPLVGVPVLVALLTKDALLRRRVRRILRTRGVCHGCRYSLIGLPVDTRNFVTCPECGIEGEVDPALGELVVDGTGQKRYQPSPASLPRAPRIFTPARVQKIRRYGLMLAFFVAVALPLGWGGYEYWLRRQAAQASSERPGPEGIAEYIEKSQPPGVERDAPNAWDAFHNAEHLLEAADIRLWRGPTSRTVPYFDMIYSKRKVNEDPAQAASDAACEALAHTCIEAYRTDGVFDELNKMASCQRAERDVSFNAIQPAVASLLPELGHARNFARINAARMKLAADAHDLKEFTEATEVNFALARICRMQPFLIDSLVGTAIEALNYSRLRELLASHPDGAWLDAVDAAIQRQGYSLARKEYFEGERLSVLDMTAWMFMDPSKVRKGQFSPSMMNMFGGSAPGRLGTYAANRDEFNDRFDALSKYVAMERWERVAPRPDPRATSSLVMVNVLMPAMDKAVHALDMLELDRRSYAVMAALERYRLAHGAYPPALAALTPGLLKQLPLDPWSGKPFGYVRLDKPDEQGREYVLYSVGADGEDNGGKAAPGEGARYEVLSGEGVKPGFDFIVNDKNR
jgi:hypothetical protein